MNDPILIDLVISEPILLDLELAPEYYVGTAQAGPNGEGVPQGGATNQVLAKKSDVDFDTEWKDTAAETDPVFSQWLSDTPPLYSETDPVVGAVGGIVKANGAGVISAAEAMGDYMLPFDIYNTNAWVENHVYAIGDRFSTTEEGGSTAYYIVHTGFTSDATYNLTGKESLNCYAYFIQDADVANHEQTYDHDLIATALQAETDPDFNAWLSTTPPLYSETDPVFSEWLNDTPPAYPEDLTGLLNETAHDLLDHTGLTGVPSITGLLNETAHDLLDHTGLTGIHASGSDAETASSIAALHLTDIHITRGNYIYHDQSKTADTIGDWRTYSDANGFYTQYCTVGNAIKGAGTWSTKFTIQI
jgi:hypothetical protein